MSSLNACGDSFDNLTFGFYTRHRRKTLTVSLFFGATLFSLSSISSTFSAEAADEEVDKRQHFPKEKLQKPFIKKPMTFLEKKRFIKEVILPQETSIYNPLYMEMSVGLTQGGEKENMKRLNAFIEKFEKDDADVILVVIGPGSRMDQEIPYYITVFNEKHPQKKVSVYSVEPRYYYEDQYPRSFLRDLDLKNERVNDISIWSGYGNNLEFSAFSMIIPENPGDPFYSRLEQIIRYKLDKNVRVLIGNHTSNGIPMDIPGIEKIFNKQFNDHQKNKFILYTQSGIVEGYYLSVGKSVAVPGKTHLGEVEVKHANKDAIHFIELHEFNPLEAK